MSIILKKSLSNFELNFSYFLYSLGISRRLFQEYLIDTHLYLSEINSSNPSSELDTTSIFLQENLKNFKEDLIKKTEDPVRGKRFLEMMTQYKYFLSGKNTTCDALITTFISYLTKKGAPSSTIRNYKSDLIQFDTFIHIHYPESLVISDMDFNNNLFTKYTRYLSEELKLASRTTQRKLSSLRSFISFAQKNNLIPHSKIEQDYKDKLSETVKQPIITYSGRPLYIAYFVGVTLLILLAVGLMGFKDQFFSKAKQLLAQSETKRPGRIINFQGRLTDLSGSPKTESQKIRFRLYPTLTDGTALYDTESCLVTPDQNGLFTSLIGGSCGGEIPQSVFTDNPSTYLGVTVNEDDEMSQRQQLATVRYAVNAETVSGLSISSPADTSTIPYIDKDGVLSIGAASPKIFSSSGNFGIVGQSLTLATVPGSNGPINLSPDNFGSVNLNFTGVNPASESGFLNLKNPNILNGSLIYAEGSPINTGYNLLQLVAGSGKNTKFSVDAAGNVNFTGALTNPDVIQASSSGIVFKTSATFNDLISDGGLGIYGSKGGKIPVTFNFTKDTTIEFDFKTNTNTFSLAANINSDNSKFYRFSWDTNNKISIQKCTPTCSEMTSTSYTFETNAWHHGFIKFAGTSIKWDLDNRKGTVNTNFESEIPALSEGGIRFVSGTGAISDFKVTPSSSRILTTGSAEVGENLSVHGSITSEAQLEVKGSGNVLKLTYDGTNYTNLSTGSNGSLTISPNGTSAKTYIQSDLVIGGSGVFYPSKTSSHDTQTSYFLVADTAGSGSILTNAGSFAAGGTDFAEVFDTDGDLSPGDVVVIRDASSIEENSPKVAKASFQTRQNLIGVITDRAGFVGGRKTAGEDMNNKTVALLGRVPIKVSSEKGPIHVGDPLTSSNILGFASKAKEKGPIIARALSDLDFENSPQNTSPCSGDKSLRCGSILAFVQFSYYDPGTQLTLDGSILGDTSSSSDNLSFSFVKELADALQNKLEIPIASSVIESKELKVFDLTASCTAYLAHIKTSEIALPEGSSDLTVRLTSKESGTPSNLLIKDENDKVVSSLNSQGDATFSGILYADSIKSKDLNNLNNSIGELGNKLNSVEDRLNTTPTPSSNSQPQATLTVTPFNPAPSTYNLEPNSDYQSSSSSASVSGEPSNNTSHFLAEVTDFLKKSETLHAKVQTFLDSSSDIVYGDWENNPDKLLALDKNIPVNPRFENLTAFGQTSLANTTISGSLMVDGTILIEGSQIQGLSDTLYLNSQESIDLMGGKLVLKKDGTLILDGTLIAKNGIDTNSIKTSGDDLTITLAEDSGNPSKDDISSISGTQRFGASGTLKVKGNLQSEGELSVKSASIAGTLTFDQIATVLSPTENFIQNGMNIPGIATLSSAGTATIPAGYQDIAIINPHIGDKTLFYITPTSKTYGRTIYISDKKPELYAKISLDEKSMYDITINWWMIN